MSNPTNEFMLPISYGLLEHLPKFGCNRMTVYLWLHFHKTVKGEEKSNVSFTYSELADFFNVSKSTIHNFIDELCAFHYIEMLEIKTGRRGSTRVKILKDKSFKDFIRVTRIVLPSERIDKVNRSPQRTNKPLIVLPSERIVLPSERIEHENPMEPEATESPRMVECNKENVYTSDFEKFWKEYPPNKRKGKLKAFRCWKTLLKNGFSPETLIVAVRRYAAEKVGSDSKFILLAATFLGPDRRFEDYLKDKSVPSPPPPDPELEAKRAERRERFKDMYKPIVYDGIGKVMTDEERKF